MDSWLEKLHDNGNKRTANGVEVAVKTNANRMFAKCVCVLCALGTSALLLFFPIEQLPQIHNSQCLLFQP